VSLAAGRKLGPYEILSLLGAGGMGEVYRATDTKLKREVAIKVLPEAVGQDPERLARFEREAQILGSLNHPHIAAIHGIEESTPVKALVMELVDGGTLQDRLDSGPIPVEEALPIARQIADALEAAHEKGIVHRDLKPANVKITPEGVVKVLDFGLARALDPAESTSSPDLSHSPTITHQATAAGVILGTAAYMSPEQARGGRVDKRADIWAFGVVLWEMLAGKRLFQGETVSDTLAAVLKTEVDFSALPKATPPAVLQLLHRCLERNPKNRLRDIGEARITIDEVLAGPGEEAPAFAAPRGVRSRWQTALPWLLAVGLGALWLLRYERAPAGAAVPTRALEFSLPPGGLLTDDPSLAFAPDGSAIAFTALDAAGRPRLWLRHLDRFDAAPLNGTENASYPFWSPDSRSIGFFRDTDETMDRYDLATAAVEVITKVQYGGRGAAWGADGTILFAPSSNSPLERVAATGGKVTEVTRLDPKVLDGSHRFPVLLPDGHHFLFTFWSNQLDAASRFGGIYLGSFEKGLERRLTPDLSQAILVGGDRVVVHRDGALVGLPFDPRTFAITGGGDKITDQPRFESSSGVVSAAGTPGGDLAYALASGRTAGQLVWLDRQGKPEGTIGQERLRVGLLALASDGRSFAAQAISASGMNIWVGDDRRQVINRLTPDAVDSSNPVWSPDGRRIAYSTEAEGSESVHVQEADGSRAAELLLSRPDRNFEATDWSADGRDLFLQSSAKGSVRFGVWIYDFEKHAARELLAEPSASLGEATLSPDERWLAYTSDESGNPEIFVRPFPALDRKWKISQGGALHSHWRRDARELVFVNLADKAMMAVDVAPRRDGLEVGIPHRLFAPGSGLLAIAPAADHSRFLAGIIPGDIPSEPVRVLLGWRRAVGGGKR
jgi:eukaryotic-like serine/threonine-protein kinase